MGCEAYFRPNAYQLRSEENLHDLLKRIALLIDAGGVLSSGSALIAKESTLQDAKHITGRTYLYESESSSGYKYRVGVHNDVRIDIASAEEKIFAISFRYGEEDKMRNLALALCELLGMYFIYNLDFEYKIIRLVHPDLNGDNDEKYHESRKLISFALRSLRRFPEELKQEEVQEEIINFILKGSRP